MNTFTSPHGPMTLHYHPLCSACRPLMMFADEHGLRLDWREIDLSDDERAAAACSAFGPERRVPLLEDGEFRLAEASAILKYLADRIGSPAYPRGLRERARVNEAMDWFGSGLALEWGGGRPGLPPQPAAHGRAEAAPATRAARLLDLLDQQMLADDAPFLLGAQITLADYQGLGLLTLGEALGLRSARWVRVDGWLQRMKARPSFARTHRAFYEHLAACRPPANAGSAA